MNRELYSSYFKEERSIIFIGIVYQFEGLIVKFANWKVFYYTEKNGVVKCEEGDMEIKIPSDTQWIVIQDSDIYYVYVTEWTKKIQGFEESSNLQKKMEKTQKEYRQQKLMEKRLYFYDSDKERLDQLDNVFYGECQYDLTRDAYQAIDQRYVKPKEDCFILGRVRRTIVTKTGKYLDFIEPIAKFKLGNELHRFKYEITYVLSEMLRFTVQKENPNALQVARIESKMHYDVQEFIKEINSALETGSIEKVTFLYKVLFKPQNL